MIFLSGIQAVYLLQQGLVGAIKMWKRREQGCAEGARGYVEESRGRADFRAMYFPAEALVLLVRKVIRIGSEFIPETKKNHVRRCNLQSIHYLPTENNYNSCDQNFFIIIIIILSEELDCNARNELFECEKIHYYLIIARK